MGKIKFSDLPENQKISKEELRNVMGGSLPIPIPPESAYFYAPRQFTYQFIQNPIQLRGTLPLPIP
jgi:hypothetical protein